MVTSECLRVIDGVTLIGRAVEINIKVLELAGQTI